MKINGIELELDLLDQETASKYEKAVALYRDKNAEKLNEAKTLSDTIKACGNATYAMIDAIWGKGTAEEVLGKRYHLQKCLDAINAIFDEEERQAKGLDEWTERFQQAKTKK